MLPHGFEYEGEVYRTLERGGQGHHRHPLEWLPLLRPCEEGSEREWPAGRLKPHASAAPSTPASRTEEGLDQEFNSLDAQREAGEAYIASQRGEGWDCLPDRYDDGGYTGGNMERPALKRLLADIEAGRVDCIVVYKVDRLSRSLLDFARIMETLEKHGVSFVSVTQQFNTTTSMGRLTLNILLSFAQFEREIISRAHPGQDRRRPAEGQVDRRHADPGLRRGPTEVAAAGQRGRGRPGAGHLRALPRARSRSSRRSRNSTRAAGRPSAGPRRRATNAAGSRSTRTASSSC